MPEMAWTSPLRSRERILAYGPVGTGKTTAAAQIARKSPSSTMHVIDCDNAWERALDTDFTEIDDERIQLHRVRGWDQFVKAVGTVFDAAERDDWIVIDDMSYPWAWVLRWYIEKTHGEELPEFMIDHRIKQISGANKATGGQDAILVEWNYINQLWTRTVADNVVNSPCHLFLCAPAKKLRTDSQGDRKEIREMYEQVGFKPEGQWRLGHQMQTILFFDKGMVSGRKLTTIKDRGREELDDSPWEDFGSDYLRKVAKWKPVVVK